MNARRARKRRQEQARYHQEQSALPPGQQDTRFRLEQIRHERAVALAKVALEFNLAIAELNAEVHEQRKAIKEEFDERIRVAVGRQTKKIARDTGEQARRLGIALPTLDEMRKLGKEPATP